MILERDICTSLSASCEVLESKLLILELVPSVGSRVLRDRNPYKLLRSKISSLESKTVYEMKGEE